MTTLTRILCCSAVSNTNGPCTQRRDGHADLRLLGVADGEHAEKMNAI